MSKVLISLPESLLALLDEAANAEAKARSALVRDAIRLYLAQGRSTTAIDALRRLRASFAQDDFVAEAAVREERDR
jgi:metal-responsive CopG/Arc/MetJ family transcriptional regulator